MVTLFICILVGLSFWYLLVPIIVVAALVWGIRAIVAFFGNLMYGDTPDYQQFRESGGDPYFGLLPPPFNTDDLAVRAGGLPEPEGWRPPEDWMFQCLKCGARNHSADAVCWHCGNGGREPRIKICGGCKNRVQEPSYGDFEKTGVVCPYCDALMKAAK